MEPDFWSLCKQEGWVAALTSYLLRLCAHQAPGTQWPPRQRQQELSLHLRWCPVPDPWGHPQSPQRGKGGAASGILGKPFCGHGGAQSPQPGSHDLPGPSATCLFPLVSVTLQMVSWCLPPQDGKPSVCMQAHHLGSPLHSCVRTRESPSLPSCSKRLGIYHSGFSEWPRIWWI